MAIIGMVVGMAIGVDGRINDRGDSIRECGGGVDGMTTLLIVK